MTEDEMVGWHHHLNGQEFEQTQEDSEGQESLVCCNPWGHKESDKTQQLNSNKPDTRSSAEKHCGASRGPPCHAGMHLHALSTPRPLGFSFQAGNGGKSLETTSRIKETFGIKRHLYSKTYIKEVTRKRI